MGAFGSIRVRCAAVIAVLAGSLFAGVVIGPGSAQAATPSVLSYLTKVSGLRTIAGVHNKEPLTQPTQYTAQAAAATGRTPGLWGGDFSFGGNDDRPNLVTAAKQQWAAGSLVTLMWHMCPPTSANYYCDWDADITAPLSDADWAALTTDGSALNQVWKSRMDQIVPYLQQLKDAGVQVLWRPDHELNDNWAWWGGRPGASGSAKLYRMAHDYLTAKGLTNLIWVWSVKDVNTSSFADYYPGDAYVDVVGLDSWNADFPSADTYARTLAVAGNKPIALTEVKKVPTPFQLARQPRWTYFMVWPEYLLPNNTTTWLKQTFGASRVLTQGELNLSAPPTTKVTDTSNAALGQPVSGSSTSSTAGPPSFTVDANSGTRWSSAYADQQWLYVDLGARAPVTGVTLNWEAAYAKKYQIQVSDDQQTWKTVYTNNTGDGGNDTISLTGVTGRYVKLYAWVRGTQYGYSLWEFQVFATA